MRQLRTSKVLLLKDQNGELDRFAIHPCDAKT